MNIRLRLDAAIIMVPLLIIFSGPRSIMEPSRRTPGSATLLWLLGSSPFTNEPRSSR